MDTALGVTVDSKGARKGAQEVNRQLDLMGRKAKTFAKKAGGHFRSFQDQLFSVKGAIGTVVAALGVGQLIETVTTFEKIEASLKTVTGSAKNAEAAFGFIKEFTATTPFQLEQVAEGFIKLNALGLTPSQQALESYGNTAVALGKDLNQMVEAVADAATGEFERLKEFGIKASSEGDKVSFTFQGVTTQIGKNAQEIEEYLIGIGQNQFAGAMSEQMDTLGGRISNLKDNWVEFLNAIGNAGATGSLKGATEFLIDGLQTARELVLELPKVFISFFAAIDKGIEEDKRNWEVLTTSIGYVWNNVMDTMKLAFANFLEFVSAGTALLPWMDDATRRIDNFATSVRMSVSDQKPLQEQLNAIYAETATRIQAIDEVALDMLADIDKQNAATEKYVAAQSGAAAADRARIAEEKRLNALMKEGRAITESLKTPLEEYEDKLFELNELFQELAISQETFNRGTLEAKDNFDKAMDTDKVTDMDKAIEHWGQTFTQSFVEAVKTGEADFRGLVQTVLDGILEMIIQTQLVDPIVSIAGDLIGSLIPGGGGTATTNHRGGIVGTTGGTRSVNPAVFAGAPRMHRGGMAGLREDEYATILQRGEEVLTRGDPRHALNGGGGGTTVNASVTVNIDSKGEASTQTETSDGQRGRELATMVKGVVVQELITQRKPGGLLA